MITVPAAGTLLDDAQLKRFAERLAQGERGWGRGLAAVLDGERRYVEIWSDACVNAWAIRWTTGTDTGFHDHDLSAAGIAVLEGLVVEERLRLAAEPVARSFGPGQSFSVPAAAIHRVRHTGTGSALTIHAYSPPLRMQGVYRVSPAGTLERQAVPYTEELREPAAA
jgi:hypothetical protein